MRGTQMPGLPLSDPPLKTVSSRRESLGSRALVFLLQASAHTASDAFGIDREGLSGKWNIFSRLSDDSRQMTEYFPEEKEEEDATFMVSSFSILHTFRAFNEGVASK